MRILNTGYFISSILVNMQSEASQFMVENTQSDDSNSSSHSKDSVSPTTSHSQLFSFNIIAAETTHIVIVTGPWHEGRHIIITTYMMNVFHAYASASLYLYTFMFQLH